MFTNQKTAKLLLLISLIIFAFCITIYYLVDNVYRYPVLGAIYEFMWLPSLAALVVIPILSVIVFIKNRNSARIYSVVSMLLILGCILIMTTA